MTYSVYQHWDPLKVCVVGRSYPPEFYSWIKVPHVRSLFEKIANETEEDYQAIIAKLQSFGVLVFRPEIREQNFVDGKYRPPPMTPRDVMIMIGDVFFENTSFDLVSAYQRVMDPSWPQIETADDYEQLPDWIRNECNNQHQLGQNCPYHKIYKHIRLQGNLIKSHLHNPVMSGAMISRMGRDLYFGTDLGQDRTQLQTQIDKRFPTYRNHIIDTEGHGDGTYCPVTPGLIISLRDVPTYSDTFPGWEVVYLPGQSWAAVKPFLDLKFKNLGRWWIPGFEYDQAVIDVVQTWLSHWTGFVEETVFDVNMLIIDPKNVMVFNYNKQVFDALDRYGIVPHIVPFRHRYFWDGGIHCVTLDLHRDGVMQDWFPTRT